MKKSTLLVISVVVLGVCCIGVTGIVVIGGLIGSDVASPLRDAGSPGTAPTPVPPAPSFEEIRQQHDVMTEAQWKQYRTQIEGTQAVEWRGWVEEVTGSPGRYVVRIDMDSPDEFLSIYEVSFSAPDDVALSLQKDQLLVFSGQIETAIDILGSLDVSLEYVTIH